MAPNMLIMNSNIMPGATCTKFVQCMEQTARVWQRMLRPTRVEKQAHDMLPRRMHAAACHNPPWCQPSHPTTTVVYNQPYAGLGWCKQPFVMPLHTSAKQMPSNTQ
jgi:hypothetical protein